MREIFSENNSRVSGDAWFSVELFLPVRTTKWGNLVLLSESGLNFLVEIFSCIRTLEDSPWAHDIVKLPRRAVDVRSFKWSVQVAPGCWPGCAARLSRALGTGSLGSLCGTDALGFAKES